MDHSSHHGHMGHEGHSMGHEHQNHGDRNAYNHEKTPVMPADHVSKIHNILLISFIIRIKSFTPE